MRMKWLQGPLSATTRLFLGVCLFAIGAGIAAPARAEDAIKCYVPTGGSRRSNGPLADYTLKIRTGGLSGAGTDSNIKLTFAIADGELQLCDALSRPVNRLIDGDAFEANQTDQLNFTGRLTILTGLTVESDNLYSGSAWYLEWVEISSPKVCAEKFGSEGCGRPIRFTFNTWVQSGNLSVTAKPDWQSAPQAPVVLTPPPSAPVATPTAPPVPTIFGSQPPVRGGPVKLPGSAHDIDVKNGVVWVVGTNPVPGGYAIYRLNGQTWTSIDGGATRIAVDNAGDPWVVNAEGTIFHRTNSSWTIVPGPVDTRAKDIAISKNGDLWLLTTGGNVSRFTGSGWSSGLGGAGVTKLIYLANTDTLQIVNESGQRLTRESPTSWVIRGDASGMADKYVDFAIDVDGTKWGVDSQNSIWMVGK